MQVDNYQHRVVCVPEVGDKMIKAQAPFFKILKLCKRVTQVNHFCHINLDMCSLKLISPKFNNKKT